VAGRLEAMLADVRWLRQRLEGADPPPGAVHDRSVFDGEALLAPASVDLVVTSPPYLNNYHYVRNTRPQLYWLGFAASPADLRVLEHASFGRFWQTVREHAPIALAFAYPELERRLELVAGLRRERGAYGGQGWANYAATYFNDTHRLCRLLARVLRPGAAALVVVGNSLLQGVEFRLDEHLARIGELAGLRVEAIQRLRAKRVGDSIVGSGARAKSRERVALYESVVVLRG
jgi:DNA modification methylase